MNRNSRINQQLLVDACRSQRAMTPAARWKRFLAAMLLALITLSAGLAPSAQAAADQGDVSFEVWAFPKPEKTQVMCVNQRQPFYVSVHKNIHKIINNLGVDFPAGEVAVPKINGSADPSNIGDLRKDISSDELEDLDNAQFTFIAKKPGTVTLTFTADVPGTATGSTDASVSGQSYSAKKAVITVKVIRCKYKAKTTVKFPVNGKENPAVPFPAIVARMDDAELTADANGHFTGTGSLRWFGATNATLLGGKLTCTAVEKFSSTSSAQLTGEMSDDGQFTLNLTYDTASSSVAETCSVATMSSSFSYVLDPIEIVAPGAGGSLSQPQGYNKSSFMGSVAIELTPEEDTASASNPGDLALSPWAAMLWKDFPLWGGSGSD